MENSAIGLTELIDQVKADLLAPAKDQEKAKLAPFLYVESVELELQVTVKREGTAGVKVDVVSIAGAELGGGTGQEKVQTVKVKLSPLYSKSEMKEYFKNFRPDQFAPSVRQSLQALKGEDTDSADETLP